MDDWVIRSAVPEDEDCVCSMWLRSLSFSRAAQRYGLEHVRNPASSDRQAWWGLNQPIVTPLFRRAQVRVACPANRSEHRAGAPAVIIGWCVSDDETVYGVGIKNSYLNAGFGQDIARDVLGPKLTRHMRYAMDLVDLWRLRMVPDAWTDATWWWSQMVWVVEQALEQGLTRDVAHHVTDPNREWWRPAA